MWGMRTVLCGQSLVAHAQIALKLLTCIDGHDLEYSAIPPYLLVTMGLEATIVWLVIYTFHLYDALSLSLAHSLFSLSPSPPHLPISVDNSEWMRNGDFIPTRLQSQQDAVNTVCHMKTRQNVENTVGLLSMAEYACNLVP